MTRYLRAASYMALLAIGCLLTIAPARAIGLRIDFRHGDG